jgi:hypothetical protein
MRILKLCSLMAAVAFAGGAGAVACSYESSVSFPELPTEEFDATLAGANEVPAVTTTAAGSAIFAVFEDSILGWRVDVADIDSTIQAHIHAGPAGTAGPVILNLFDASTVNCKQNADTALQIVSSSVGNPTTITTVAAHRLTVGSTPLMRIAGHAGSTPSLDGEHTATVTGTTTFTIPVNVTIAGTGGTAQRFTTFAPSATPRERFDSLISLMRAGEAYVNVHTRTNPGGEVRGQLGPR